MFKKLFFLSALLLSGFSFGQSAPTLYSVTYDTLCNYEQDVVFMTITIEDLDMDSTYISGVTLNNAVLSDQTFPPSWSSPAYNVSETLRSFTVKGSTDFGNPPGLNLADITVQVTGAIGVEGPPVDINLTDVPVYGDIMADLTVADVTFCSNAFPLDLSIYEVVPGGSFNWADSNADIVESNTFDPAEAYPTYVNDGGEYFINYEYSNSAGCTGSNSMMAFYDVAPEASMIVTPSTCENADGDATATVFGGAPPYDVYWTTGFSEQVSSISTINNLSSGVYYMNYKDANQCKGVSKANVADADFIVTPNITPQYCKGQTGSVDLSVSSSGTVTSTYWSNGQTASNMTAPSGEYSVEIHTDNNCNFFATYLIPDSSLRVIVNDVYDNFNCLFTPDGYVDITTVGGTGMGTYTWDWTKNTSPFATSEDINGIDGGLYVCTVSDNNGCEYAWNETIENVSNVFLYTNKVEKSTCGNTDGEVDIFIDTFGDVPTFYEWSNGSTDEDLVGVGSGSYTLTYTDQGGCTNYLTVKVIDELPYQPQICLLTVDTSYTYNQIVWEKIPGENIDGFNVYRETSVLGKFELVADRPYALESFFMDNSSSPVDRSWRYKITTYDACGNESHPSFIHKTIHTVSNTSNGTDFTINWDDYEGLSYTDMTLWRFDDTNGWQDIGTHSVGTNSDTDIPPVLSGLDYFVEFNLTDGCQSTKATDYNSSRSNKADGTFTAGGSTTSIEDKKYGMINIYPNPTSSMVNLYIEQYDMFERIELRDMNGRILSQKNISNQNEMIDLSEFANGVYFISIISGDESHQEKVIKR